MEWKEVYIKDICTVLGDGLHGTPEYDEKGDFYFINGNNLQEGHITIKKDTKRVSQKEFLKYQKELNDRTILVSINGTIGNVAKYNNEPCILGKSACFFNVKEDIDRNFIYYVISSPHFKKSIIQQATGTTIKNVSLKQMRDYHFLIPVNLSDQRKIAGILSALDSKIENNNKINANLEAQAQALFKSWFVDFTPFKDQPFVDSELGPIPQGWKVGKLGDICTFKRGKNLLSKNAIDEGVPVVAGGLSPSCYHNQANTSAPVVTVSGSGANAGFMRMYHVDVWASDCSFIDVSCDYLYFVYCFLSVNRRLLKHAQTGAVQPHVKPADIHDFDVVIPEEDIVKAFQSIIKELLTKVGVNEKENQRLAALRDTLLPKLMSGEIKL